MDPTDKAKAEAAIALKAFLDNLNLKAEDNLPNAKIKNYAALLRTVLDKIGSDKMILTLFEVALDSALAEALAHVKTIQALSTKKSDIVEYMWALAMLGRLTGSITVLVKLNMILQQLYTGQITEHTTKIETYLKEFSMLEATFAHTFADKLGKDGSELI